MKFLMFAQTITASFRIFMRFIDMEQVGMCV